MHKLSNMDVYMKFSLVLMLLMSSQVWAKWSVSTYNIRNFDRDPGTGRTDLVELTKIIKSVKSDVMAFEEVVNRDAFVKLMAETLPGYKYAISKCGGAGKQLLAVAYDPKVFDYSGEVEDLTFSGEGSDYCDSLRPLFFVSLKHKVSQERYTFGAVHLKAGGTRSAMTRRWEQYAKLGKVAGANEKNNLILLGDFNTTGFNLRNEDYVKFDEFLVGSGLQTVIGPNDCTNYWEGTLPGKEFESSILDHVVLQDKMMGNVQNVKIGAHCAVAQCRPATSGVLGKSFQSVSDHCPVQVTFK